ncbi:cyclic nucleotide-binding domain-containing protein [Mammaliicoccus sciuri]|uniref:cyclic nucleotide-binding domain-containing protein n=1 Tax=Mammaliicoccus sciuri TaxID=1296 RepID=UPI001E2CCEEE|nr:cyclic nucleotide-binding domain-containing protein [Mammaliicoccus sciuri]MCD8817772.1 cyclic nucleotide-binding domain-containing protein [Mammaliicoccus sciuri]
MREIYNDKLKQDLIDQFNYLDLFGFDMQQHVKLFFISQKDHIIQDTQKPEYLFYLVKGKTKLYEYMENGQVSLIDFFDPSSFIGEMELIDEHAHLLMSKQ